MACPALLMRHINAPAWDNAFINFDQRSWFPAPNYVVMNLWHEHYAPNLLELTGDSTKLNIIATKSADGKRLFIKTVNPTTNPIAVKLNIKEGFTVGHEVMWIVAPGDLSARNTLELPNQVKVQRGDAKIEGSFILFTMPPISAGVVSMKAK
jgi:alpha-N-arabinofuranosidase